MSIPLDGVGSGSRASDVASGSALNFVILDMGQRLIDVVPRFFTRRTGDTLHGRDLRIAGSVILGRGQVFRRGRRPAFRTPRLRPFIDVDAPLIIKNVEGFVGQRTAYFRDRDQEAAAALCKSMPALSLKDQAFDVLQPTIIRQPERLLHAQMS
ncbi:hypothetical protein N8E89_26195 (plasmid) [Phyllobacterium sp. A18/5-2]|uniref:hypothetical protein n=1 Tax=Phyllobacterium sp. A18/5-2 TaxID=2978392 RepID=UPI0021C67B61|nr:hypothetical protein [Phyllobacterium sp. A18/5-2]UXN66579.1 hypothetical protein N8E89_26195 [Phyllobacterium sp. A18/5-2]